MKIRLDKYLTEMSVGSRSEVKKAIIKGLTEVNGETVKNRNRKSIRLWIRFAFRDVGSLMWRWNIIC
ncbi:hypothetical protein HMPREF0988_00169 [Lachnospiraceae bacterium 1_4_56FAA]|nr:hypothetical protein HMPREF0988_00169 [Lachnospiraceae bacterium 1_4_56FAA]